MNWKQEMGWKGEPTKIIQAQPRWKVRLLSGSYSSHEIRIGEGSQMLPSSSLLSERFFLTKEQDSFPSAISNGWEGGKNAAHGLKQASNTTCFHKALPTATAGLGAPCPRCCTSMHPLIGAREEEGLTSGLPEFPRFPVKSDFFGAQVPAAISSTLGLLAVLLKSKL